MKTRLIIYMISIVLMFFQPVYPQQFFNSHEIAGDGIYPVSARCLIALDFDKDDDIDYLTANRNSVRLHSNDGNRHFSSEIIINSPLRIEKIDTADIDNDGDIDIISIGSEICWYENEDNDNFVYHGLSYQGADYLDVKDMDSDGDMDFVTVLDNYNKMLLFINDGEGNFSEIELNAGTHSNYCIKLFDLDNDGNMDIINSGMDGDIIWHKNNGILEFEMTWLIETNNQINNISIIDIDNDGDNDIIAGSYNNIFLFENEGNETFSEHTISDEYGLPWDYEVIDFDSDDDFDIVSSSYDDDLIFVFRNDGELVFSKVIISDNIHWVRKLDVDDFNGDGMMDIMIDAEYMSIVCLENQGNNDFEQYNTASYERSIVSIKKGDIDNDGDIDFVTGSISACVSWYENIGDGEFLDHDILFDGLAPQYAEPVDFDFDGDMDILASFSLDSTIVLFRNDGNQNFTGEILADGIWFIHDISAADLDNDGDLDIAYNFGEEQKTSWYENIDGVSFLPHTLASGNSWYGVHTEDIDKDGDIDIIAPLFTDSSECLAVYYNDGAGGFTEKIIASDIFIPGSIFTEDINGDSYPDIITTEGSNKIAWYENIQQEEFIQHYLTENIASAQSVYAADIGGDGDIDIISCGLIHDTCKVVWFENQDGYNFGTTYYIETMSNSIIDLTAADFNNDGFIDIMVASTNEGRVEYLENTGLISSITNPEEIEIPEEYILRNNYPNPFNPETTISFSIPDPGRVTIRVYDILGKLVETLINTKLTRGEYKVNFNAKNLSSGIYFYRLESGSFSEVRKMIVLK